MAEQMMSEVITRAMVEATRVVLQMMAEAQAQRTQNATGPKLGGPTLKQPTFNWKAPDRYTELKNIYARSEQCAINIWHARGRKVGGCKKLAREKRAPLFRNPNAGRKGGMQHARWFV